VRVLVVAATAAEIAPLVAQLQLKTARGPRMTAYTSGDRDVDVLITGVGMVATATWCSHVLSRERYDVALNLGVCGSFDRSLTLGTVVHVATDRLSELGAEDGDAFLPVHQLQLVDENEPPFVKGRLVNQSPPDGATLASLRVVDGITVNTVHGRDASIAHVTGRFAPHVESMEGAAFMYACLVHWQRFAQVRAVSNFVERRNRSAWNMPAAIANLGSTAQRMLGEA
jgi:futalosine hydrolase